MQRVLFAFRRLREDDLPLLADWLARPHVAAVWTRDEPSSLARVRREFLPDIEGRTAVTPYLALRDDVPIGFIQSYVVIECGDGWWPDERDPGARGVDQFLADADDWNRGLGTAMVRAFVAELFRDPAVTKIQTDPAPGNARAIRCYEKAGLRTTSVVDTPDGPAVLMTITRDRFDGRR